MTKADLVDEISGQTGISRQHNGDHRRSTARRGVSRPQRGAASSRFVASAPSRCVSGAPRRARNPRSGNRSHGAREARSSVQAEQGAQGPGDRWRPDSPGGRRGLREMIDGIRKEAEAQEDRDAQAEEAACGRTVIRSVSADSPPARLLGRAQRLARDRWTFEAARRSRGGRYELDVSPAASCPEPGDWCIAEPRRRGGMPTSSELLGGGGSPRLGRSRHPNSEFRLRTRFLPGRGPRRRRTTAREPSARDLEHRIDRRDDLVFTIEPRGRARPRRRAFGRRARRELRGRHPHQPTCRTT